MQVLRSIFILFVVGAFSNSLAFANQDVQTLNLLEGSAEKSSLNQVLAYSTKSPKQDTRKTYVRFPSTKSFEPAKSIFFQINIGVGFLYFSGLRANLMGRPVMNFFPLQFYRDAPLKGRLSYNRTPLFEYLLGYRFNPWLKLALSYQHQGGVGIQSKTLSAFETPVATTGTLMVQLTSNLSLDALLAKVYFELPYAIIFKNLSINPYLAAGVGPGWQSWTRIEANYIQGNDFYQGNILSLRQKISANAVWMIDVGLRIQNARPNNLFSAMIGCKYNQWGQARSIGKMTQQGSHKIAFTHPLIIKTVYQFAPYLGVQWNFAADRSADASYKLKEKSPQVWLPYWTSSRKFQCSRAIWTQFNTGIGFLYFSGLRANLLGHPFGNFGNIFPKAPLKGRLTYNRTPLFEYLLGYRFNLWLKLAFSYQHQGGVTVQSKVGTSISTTSNVVQFTSNLSLDAILAKVYLELPYAMIFRGLSTNPYLAVGIGPGWQSWTRVQSNYIEGLVAYLGNVLNLRQKISANAVWMIDMGLRVQSAYPNSHFSVLMGCKYNQWGQARSIGKITQQGAYKIALTQPLRVKTVYQFAPYLGVQWNFPADRSAGASYKLKEKSPQVWLPYWVSSREFQCSRAIWTQFNAGIGFLYFSGLRANLMGRPFVNLSDEFRDAPLKGRLSYNRTPLFEYLLGYRFNLWLKLALSYQHQGGVTVQSKVLSTYVDPPANTDVVQFTSNLSLDAILAKVYFELPYAMIFRGLSINPYLAAGVGPAWQSWTLVKLNYVAGNTSFSSYTLNLRQKISANAVWMIDIGLRVQSAYLNSRFSVLVGCKYNQWGQARSIGKLSQQKAHKLALSHPLIVKTVYQFAPYLGVQWNF